MMCRTAVAAAAALLACLGAVGCYESPEVTWYEPGVYKGASDPLVGRLKKDALPRQLEKRLRAVQTDR